MTHLGLFEGIGGFSLAARWMGWETLAWCEIDPFCQTVLKHHFPNAIGYGDIKTVDFKPWAGKIDILTGGFPCQPFSASGKQLGNQDDRFLWPEMLRAVCEIKPKLVVAENVPNIINSGDGMVFESACADLENEGYQTIPLLLPAAGVEANHIRERLFLVGKYCGSSGLQELNTTKKPSREKFVGRAANNAHPPISMGQYLQEQGKGKSSRSDFRAWVGWHGEFPSQPLVCFGNDGLPDRLDGITVSKWRYETIAGAGNAIVPQLAYRIFQSMQIANLDSEAESPK